MMKRAIYMRYLQLRTGVVFCLMADTKEINELSQNDKCRMARPDPIGR